MKCMNTGGHHCKGLPFNFMQYVCYGTQFTFEDSISCLYRCSVVQWLGMYIGMNWFTLTSWLHPPNVCAQLKHRVEGEAIVAEYRSQCCTVQDCLHVLLIAMATEA